MSEREDVVTGQHFALTTREEVHVLRAEVAGLAARVNVLERDQRDALDHRRDHDQRTRHLWLWALGLLVTIAITVVSGMLALNSQVARLEERVDALRYQVAHGQPRQP